MVNLAILAGGEGTRLRSVHPGPKCLVPLGDRPLLAHQLELAWRHGVGEAWLLVGRGADEVAAYVEGSSHRDRVTLVREARPLGTAGGFAALGARWAETLLVLYGDVACNVDLGRFLAFHRERGGAATLLVHPNDHPFDSDLIEVDGHDRITAIHRKPHPPGALRANLVNACAYLVEPELRALLPDGPADWAHDVFPEALARGMALYAYRSSEYLKDLGTPERLAQVRRDFARGKIARGSYEQPRGAVFLDRDGTINREVDRCHRLEDFELLPGAAEAIARVNRSEHLAVVVTNQPVVACGFCTLEELAQIHRKMDTLLAEAGAYVDALYFCPHHPESGFPGENPAYKVACDCRKPHTGMLRRAVAEHHIDPARSVMIGDSTRDVEAGRRMGVRTVLLETGYGGRDGTHAVRPDHTAADLGAAVDAFLKGGLR